MVRENSYITVQAFMVNDLHLKGNELLVYALIYGFSQDGESVFSGSSKYISDWIGVEKKNALAILKRLVEKGFLLKIERVSNGVKLCDYKAVNPMQQNDTTGVKTTPPRLRNDTGGGYETTPGGGYETSPHNTSIDNLEEKNIYTRTQQKKSYGEFKTVKLTDEEYQKLKQNYTECHKDAFEKGIEILDRYLASKGKQYKSHYAVMKQGGWVWCEAMKQAKEEVYI